MVIVLLGLFFSPAHSQSQPPATIGDVIFEEYPLYCKSKDGIRYVVTATANDGLKGFERLLLDMGNEAKQKGIEPECVQYAIPLFFTVVGFEGQLHVLDESRRYLEAVWNVIEATARYREGKKFFVFTLRNIAVPR